MCLVVVGPGAMGRCHRTSKRRSPRFSLCRVCLSACVFLAAQASYSQQSGGIYSLGISADAKVSFNWSSNSEPNLAGYRLYVGTAPGLYTGFVDVGRVTTFELSGLIRGMTYYFALTAYSIAGLESDFTPELTRQIPLLPASIQTPQLTAAQELDAVFNSPPAISAIPDQVLAKNRRSHPIPFTVHDLETSADVLQIAAYGSNPLVVPSSGLVIEGSHANRTLVIDPVNGESGASIITIAVTDGAATTTVSFLVTVEQHTD
jgi:hypothetical protein